MKYTKSTLDSYDEIDRTEIQYGYCRNFDHISRYRTLRQVTHEGSTPERYVALETPNPFETHTDVTYYTVPARLVNRLDIIANEQLGSASYRWVLAYFNRIADGFTVNEGQVLAIPKSITALLEKGEVLSPVPATQLNLGSE